jgi:membrane protease YdiL (CAAX protease family)
VETILLILSLFFLLALIIVANILALRSRRYELLAFDIFLFLVNLPVLLIGILFLLMQTADFQDQFADAGFTFSNLSQVSLVLILMAGWGLVVSVGPARRLLARIMPLDPASPVHTLALVFAGYLAGQGALTLSQDGLSGLADTVQPVSIMLIVVSEIMLAVLAFFGVGLLIRRNWSELVDRLGLTMPDLKQLLIAGAIIVALVIVQAGAGALWALLNPDQAELLGDVNTLLLADMDTLWEWLLLALAAGIGEELLFRGALQPVMGLAGTSLLFALVHVQYGYTPFMLVVVFIAVVLGLIRRYFSTTIAIVVHVGYDFTLGLLALLATYLQQYVT